MVRKILPNVKKFPLETPDRFSGSVGSFPALQCETLKGAGGQALGQFLCISLRRGVFLNPHPTPGDVFLQKPLSQCFNEGLHFLFVIDKQLYCNVGINYSKVLFQILKSI